MSVRKIFSIVMLSLLFTGIDARGDNQDGKINLKLSGFIRNDFAFDTRQTVAAREGLFLLWPEKIIRDDNGDDINAVANFNFLAVLTRLSLSIEGPDALGARVSGLIETDFFAQANENIGLLRLRHALIRMNWEKSELLIGQYWNPLFVTDNYPVIVSANSGTPFNSFARNPQIRFTATSGGLKIIAAALAQRDYASWASRGPGLPALASPSYLRNSGIPNMHLQIHYQSTAGSNSKIAFGAGAAYKSIRPRLVTDGAVWPFPNNKVNERVGGITAIVFGRLVSDDFSLKLYARYGENNTDVLSPGGYAALNYTMSDLTYVPLRNLSFWADLNAGSGQLQPGFFAGYLLNRGSGREASPSLVFGRATDLGAVMRLSPRLCYSSGKLKLSGEIEFTRAWYGEHNYNSHGLPQDSWTGVSNVRLLSTVIYSF